MFKLTLPWRKRSTRRSVLADRFDLFCVRLAPHVALLCRGRMYMAITISKPTPLRLEKELFQLHCFVSFASIYAIPLEMSLQNSQSTNQHSRKRTMKSTETIKTEAHLCLSYVSRTYQLARYYEEKHKSLRHQSATPEVIHRQNIHWITRSKTNSFIA